MQTAETYKKGGEPTFVDELDAIAVGQKSGMPIAPVMIYGDDVSHVVTSTPSSNAMRCRQIPLLSGKRCRAAQKGYERAI